MAADTVGFPLKNDAGTLLNTFHLPLNKLDATAAPMATDDDAAGYVRGSIWADRTNNLAYMCINNSTGAAVWIQIGSIADGTYGDIVITGSGGTWTIADGAVTFEKTDASVQLASRSFAPPPPLLPMGIPSAAWAATGGDVTAASSFGTDNVLLRSDGTGKGVQICPSPDPAINSGVITADDNGNIFGVGELRCNDVALYSGSNALALFCADTLPSGSSIGFGVGGAGGVTRTVTFAGDTTLSGTNTGDQTISLGGEVSASGGTGALTTTLTAAGILATRGFAPRAPFLPLGLPPSSWSSGAGDALTSQPLSQFAPTTSAQLVSVISDETGSGPLVFATSPTLTTPNIGAATAATVNKVTITTPATGSTLTIDDGFTLRCTGNVTALSGSHTGTSSGTNTGDQTFTASGDATAAGSTSNLSLTISAAAVTFPKTDASVYLAAQSLHRPAPVLPLGLPPASWPAGGGSGTVTTVSVVTANGVSGSVANATTTPAITLTLGAITPTSVAASGTVTGSNLSGTNTGDQTITLTGDVTGSGTGSFAATIAAAAVTFPKIDASVILAMQAFGA